MVYTGRSQAWDARDDQSKPKRPPSIPHLTRNQGITALIGDPFGGARLFPECFRALAHDVSTSRALPSSRLQLDPMEVLGIEHRKTKSPALEVPG
jgi:hypothetical protein